MEREFEDMATLERELEKRFEKACEKNGWSATAYLQIGGNEATLMLDKHSESPITKDDVISAQGLIKSFISAEFGISDIAEDKVLSKDEEKIPNTIAPYHITLTARIGASDWLKRVA